MPQRVRAASCMVNSLSTNFAPQYRGIWITDALLADTFDRFCHSPRRYGSNVPGPLEARRRASKRKNTSLAYVGGGQHTYDLAVMLGSGSEDKWWKRVETKPAILNRQSSNPQYDQETSTKSSPSLPVWLREPAESARAQCDGSHGEKRLERARVAHEETPNVKDLEYQFKSCIASKTITLTSVLDVIKDMRLDLRKYRSLSKIAFSRIVEACRSRGDYEGLAPALYEPVLHPPGSHNHYRFLQRLCSEGVSREQWKHHIFPAILRSIELGLSSIDDIQQMIQIIPKIHESTTLSDTRGIQLANGQTWSDWISSEAHSNWHSMLISIEQCRVLHLQDFDAKFLSSWYLRAVKSIHSDITCHLIWKLRAYSNLSELALASKLIVRRLHDLVRLDRKVSAKTIDWFVSIPTDLQGPVIIYSTFRMTAAAQSGDKSGTEVIDKWSTMLSMLRLKKPKESLVTKSAWSRVPDMSHELSRSQQILVIMWILTKIWTETPDIESRFIASGFRDEFEKSFSAMKNVDQFDHVARMVLAMDDLPLPDKNAIFSLLQNFTEDNLIKMLGNGEHLEGIKNCLTMDYASLQDHNFYRTARKNYPELLRALTESVNKDLNQFRAMAQALILKSNQNFVIVRRLLNSNMELKFAATQAWPTAMRKHQSRKSVSDLNPFAVIELLESLTMTFAVTPVISPRSSFRHVYNMYLFFHKAGAPLNPIVGRALWHSGVTRYGKSGASNTQVAWCYSKVMEIEGQDVANRLVYSAGFRVGLVRDFVKTLAQTHASLELPSDLDGVQPWGDKSETARSDREQRTNVEGDHTSE